MNLSLPIYKSDAALVQACLDGDEHAWTVVAQRYRKLIKWIARLKGLNNDDAEDIAQIVLLRVSQNLNSLRDPKGLKAWISQITRNEIVRLFKTRKETVPLSDTNVPGSNGHVDQVALMDAYCTVERKLPAKYLKVFKAVIKYPLLYNDDEALAAMLNLSPNTAHTYRTRVFAIVKKEFKLRGITPSTKVPKSG